MSDNDKNVKKEGRTNHLEDGVTAVAGGISKIAVGFRKNVKDITSGTVDAIFNPSTIPERLDKAFDTIAVEPTKRTVNFFGELQHGSNAAFRKRVADARKGARRLTVVFAPPIMDLQSSMIDPAKIFKKTESAMKLIREAINESVLFAALDEKELAAIIDTFEPMFYKKKSIIVKQGDPGDYFYVIDKGEIAFKVDNKDVGFAGHGKIFGELALLYDAPRTATCIAKTECGLYRLDQVTFRKIIAKQSNDELVKIVETLKRVAYFKDLDDAYLFKIANNLQVAHFSDGEIIAKKETAAQFFIIESGKVKFTEVKLGGSDYMDTELVAGNVFGESMMMNNTPYLATILAVGNVKLFTLKRSAFLHVCGDDWISLSRRKVEKMLLKHIPFGKRTGPTDNELDRLTSCIKDKEFSKGHVFFKEGHECSPCLYMLRKGKVSLRSASMPEMETVLGCKLGSGDVKEIVPGGYFGNDTLSDNGKGKFGVANYTVEVLEDVKVGVLDFDAFSSVFMPRSAQDIKQSDLNLVRILGAGTFGKVWLVSRKGTNEAYALKIQVKKQLIKRNQVDGVIRENEVMTMLNHPFLISLVSSYKDDHKLYMLLKLYQGGELEGVIHTKTRDGLPEEAAKFYAAGILEGLSHMHHRNILYRDLKPENVLLDSDGYTVIVDMGFAKVVKGKTYTFCGTPLYLAPEVIMQKGHDKSADHWSWGVLLYEMIVGMTPFYDGIIDQMGVFKNIVRQKYEFPENVKMTMESKDLIAGMLKHYPHRRLGSSFRADMDIRNHSWFVEVDWKKLVKKQIKVPFKPEVSDPLDGSNFDDHSKLENESKNEKMDTLSRVEQCLFDAF